MCNKSLFLKKYGLLSLYSIPGSPARTTRASFPACGSSVLFYSALPPIKRIGPVQMVRLSSSIPAATHEPSPTALSSAGDFHEMKTGGIATPDREEVPPSNLDSIECKCDLFHVNHHAWCLIILLRFSLMRQPSIRCMGVPRKE
ncbi:hypothetical protein QVD17_12503 [Tagetes erecta]|uniref:Uncharacterized protein n=1 Tax=Tagetes erecta TaxID=13708 RepID=A0AAD8P1M0_TARER|nr:hypothetical protein QVD17_12503 [Tagetes erecta]